MKKLKFNWNATEEQLEHLARMARATGHKSIRELFGMIVSAGLQSISQQIEQEMERIQEETHATSTEASEEPALDSLSEERVSTGE
jgi:hypothetical protein